MSHTYKSKIRTHKSSKWTCPGQPTSIRISINDENDEFIKWERDSCSDRNKFSIRYNKKRKRRYRKQCANQEIDDALQYEIN